MRLNEQEKQLVRQESSQDGRGRLNRALYLENLLIVRSATQKRVRFSSLKVILLEDQQSRAEIEGLRLFFLFAGKF